MLQSGLVLKKQTWGCSHFFYHSLRLFLMIVMDKKKRTIYSKFSRFPTIPFHWQPTTWPIPISEWLGKTDATDAEVLTMFEILFANWSPPCRVLVDNLSEWFSIFFLLYRVLADGIVLSQHLRVYRRKISHTFQHTQTRTGLCSEHHYIDILGHEPYFSMSGRRFLFIPTLPICLNILKLGQQRD